jgi:hypothetical protein
LQLPERHPALFFIAILSASAVVAGLAVWTYSRARTPFDYMVVGTLAASVGLAGVFAALVKRKAL